MTTEMTIEQYLRGSVTGYDIPDEMLRVVLYKNQVSEGTLLIDISEDDFQRQKILDFCLADVYEGCAMFPSTRNNSSEADGQWKSEQGGYQRSKRDADKLIAKAKELRAKYSSTTKSGIRMCRVDIKTEL